MKISRLNNSALVIGSLVFSLLLFQNSLVWAALEFDPTRSLTAGYLGDRPDLPQGGLQFPAQ